MTCQHRPVRQAGSPSTRARVPRAAIAGTVASLALLVAGCSATNPITTSENYAASDGVRVELGEAVLTNLLVLTAAEGSEGTVLGAVSNNGQDDLELTLTLEGSADEARIDLPAGATVLLGPDEEEVVLDSVPAPPGALVAVSVVSDRSGAVTVRVPVLDGTLPEYADLVPEEQG